MRTTQEEPGEGHRPGSLDGPAVVAHTTEDDQHPEVRQAAQAHAKEHGCVLILFAADVASWLSEPMPNQWASEGEADRFGDRLSADDLDFLGRSALAEQVRESHRGGIKTSAWLPKDKGVEALADYASSQGAHVVFVPESLASIDKLGPLLEADAAAPDGRRTQPSLRVVMEPDPTRS